MQRGWMSKDWEGHFLPEKQECDMQVEVVILTAAEHDAREAVVKAAQELKPILNIFFEKDTPLLLAINALDALEGEA